MGTHISSLGFFLICLILFITEQTVLSLLINFLYFCQGSTSKDLCKKLLSKVVGLSEWGNQKRSYILFKLAKLSLAFTVFAPGVHSTNIVLCLCYIITFMKLPFFCIFEIHVLDMMLSKNFAYHRIKCYKL